MTKWIAYLLFLSLIGCNVDPFLNTCETNGLEISPRILTSDSTRIFLPSAFTPNGDGLNDNFYPVGDGIKSFSLTVCSNNNVVFEGKENEKWNGLNAKNELFQGNYDYEIEVLSNKNKNFEVTGRISLITDPLVDACKCRFEDMIDPWQGFVMPSNEGCK